MSVVLITGCSSGFGHAGALAFARNGDTVYASMRDIAKAEMLRRTADKDALDVRIVELDVTRPATFPALVASIVKESGQLDVLVNNAGVLRAGAFEDLEETDLREVMETNFFGPFLLARAVLPQMRQQHGGYIIMISSLSGIAGLPGDVAYTASKFAVEGATEALRHEVDRWDIKLALVEAGLYATRIFDSSLPAQRVLPRAYPESSPYRPLVEHRLRELRARLPDAFDPRDVAELLVRIARSDGRQLRWPADDIARKVLATLFALDDTARDTFLRSVSGTDWWSSSTAAPAPARPDPHAVE
jgi:NAD(P)-dependent dehydrogenase (short-subunit alcohol dehydrogenase family)